MRRGRGLRDESEKHAHERAERDRVVREVRNRDRGCRAREVVSSPRCSGPLDVHEIIPRSAWRRGYLDVDNCIVVCRGHHDWIGDNPGAAHDVGLHGYSWERSDDGNV